MQRKRRFWLPALLSVLLALLAACGQSPNTPTTTSTSKNAASLPAGENLYVLDGYTSSNQANQHIIAFHPGSNTTMTLPTGLTTRDHRFLVTATPQGAQSVITVTDTHTGNLVRSLTIPGVYSTAGALYTTADLSYDGQWLALREIHAGNTTIALIDTTMGKLVKTIQLKGTFDLDVVANDGNRLYLLQRLSDTAGHYLVRRYDVDENLLYTDPIVEKGEADPDMVGNALTRQMGPGKQIAYTLYTEPKLNKAFIHMLPLDDSWPTFAVCLDLPVGKSPELLRYYTLTISPDGTMLYAANAALGLGVSISLDPQTIFNSHVSQSSSFHVDALTANTQATMYNGAALSADEKILYIAGTHGILALSTFDFKVMNSYLMKQSFTGIALSGDGKALYAVDPSTGITAINLASGQINAITGYPAHSPQGIAWVAN